MLIKHLQNKVSVLMRLIIIALICANIIHAQDCKSKVEIVTNNADALIFVDNVFIGNGNANIEIEKGNHFILVKEKILKWNHEEIRDTVTIDDCSKTYKFNYNFRPSLSNLAKKQNIEFSISAKNESFFNSSTFKILLGSAAVLGGVAAYYKIQADKKYDEYLISKSQSTLDEVNRLDLYSGLSFGLLQINFGYLIYKFLTD